MRAALYARVSTKDKEQDPQNQVFHLQAFAEKQNWRVVEIYEDHESAGGKKLRERFETMMKDAGRKKFDVVLFWSLDRFSREGVLETLLHLKKLTDMDVNWRSYTEQYLDSLGPFKDAVLAILASIARQEHIRMGERVRAGIERRKREGVRWGHWRRKEVDMGLLKQMREDRYSVREIAKVMRVSPTTVVVRLKELEK